MKYRDNNLFGAMCTNAAAVMAHEIFALGNVEIPLTLAKGMLEGTEEANLLLELSEPGRGISQKARDIIGDYCENKDNGELVKEFFNGILAKVREKTGVDVQHVLWLCDSIGDLEEVYEPEGFGFNLGEVSGYSEVDESAKEPVVLANDGQAGKLYGYHTLPKEAERWERYTPYSWVNIFNKNEKYQSEKDVLSEPKRDLSDEQEEELEDVSR